MMPDESLAKRRHTGSSKSHDKPTRSQTRKPNVSYDYTRENLRHLITHLYGEVIFRRTRRYEKLKRKITKLLCDLAFLKRCRDSKILPTFTKLKYHNKSPTIAKILKSTSSKLLVNQIRKIRFDLNKIQTELFGIHLELSNKIHPTLWFKFDTLVNTSMETDKTKFTKLQTRKFERLSNSNLAKKLAHSSEPL